MILEQRNDQRNKIKEFDDKSAKAVYGGMQGVPMYPKKLRCGMCGTEWSKPKEE